MAEIGAKSLLTSEVNAAIADGNAASVISGGGIGRSPGRVAVTFEATAEFPLLTLVSMIAPSPDWFVGVDGFALTSPSGIWTPGVTVDLAPWDAGTDSGAKYRSGNEDTNPQIPIALITHAPFDNGEPLGTFAIELIPDFNGDHIVNGEDLTDPVSGWETRFDVDLNGGALLAWQRDFGRLLPITGGMGSVPEPAAGALWAAGLVLFRFCAAAFTAKAARDNT